MARRRPQSQARGFALLVVVLLVALIAVAAVALLDIVQVDLLVVGQHRRTMDAQAVAVGAMMEVISDDTLRTQLPDPSVLSLAYQYAGKQGANYVRDPTGRFVTIPMTAANSAFVRAAGTSVEQGYDANVELLRVSNPTNTGLTDSQTLTYEVTVVSSINNGEATKEVRAQISRVVGVQSGTLLTTRHAR